SCHQDPLSRLPPVFHISTWMGKLPAGEGQVGREEPWKAGFRRRDVGCNVQRRPD
ncbi:unnamed protein product, partial [Closterium sp. NIES-53]